MRAFSIRVLASISLSPLSLAVPASAETVPVVGADVPFGANATIGAPGTGGQDGGAPTSKLGDGILGVRRMLEREH